MLKTVLILKTVYVLSMLICSFSKWPEPNTVGLQCVTLLRFDGIKKKAIERKRRNVVDTEHPSDHSRYSFRSLVLKIGLELKL